MSEAQYIVVDVKSAIARLGLGAVSTRPDPESQIEYLAWFRFPVAWTYLSGPASEVESEVFARPLLASPALTLAPVLRAPGSRNQVVPDAAGVEEGLGPAGSAARWEMMVPRMAGPPARQVAILSADAAPAPHPASAKAASLPARASSLGAPVSAVPAPASLPGQFAPSFSLHSPEDQFLARYWPQIVFAAIAIIAIGCLIWGLSSPSAAARSATSSAINTASWSHQPASPSGRSLALYEPSRAESDYRMEFGWVPDAAGVGWVFRTRDRNNYYGARLSLQQSGTNGALVAEHFSVLAGAESAHSRKMIPLGNRAGLVKVHMDAIGPAFKLFVEGNQADSWTDARLSSGAVGFSDDGARLPKLLALSLTFINKTVSRTVLVSLP